MSRIGVDRLLISLKHVLSGPLRVVRLKLTIAATLALGGAGLQGAVLLLIQQTLPNVLPGRAMFEIYALAVLIFLALTASALLEFWKDRIVFLAWRSIERHSLNAVLLSVAKAAKRGAIDPNRIGELPISSLRGVSSQLGSLTRIVASGLASGAASLAFLITLLALDLQLGSLLLAIILPVSFANLAIIGRRVTRHARKVPVLARESQSDLTKRVNLAASGSASAKFLLPQLKSWNDTPLTARTWHSVGRLRVISDGRVVTSIFFSLTVACLLWFTLGQALQDTAEVARLALITVALIATLRQFAVTLSTLTQAARFIPAIDQYEAVLEVLHSQKTPDSLLMALNSVRRKYGSRDDEDLP